MFLLSCEETWPSPRSSKFFPMLFSRSFIVSCFAFKSVIHFKLIFVEDVRSVYVEVQLFQYCHLMKRQSVLHWFFSCSVDFIYACLFLCALFCSIDLFVYFFFIYFFCQYHTFNSCSFIVSLESSHVSLLTLLFFSIVLSLLGHLPFHIHFRTSLSIPSK